MRKRGYGSLIWGGLLVVLGLGLLAENLDLLGEWQAPIWSLLLGAFGLVFLTIFFRDREQWWALIPGLVILGVAVAVFLAEQDLVAGHIVGTIILGGVGLPFLLIFLADRQHWWALIPGMTMTAAAVGVFLEGIGAVSGEAVGGLIVGGGSLGFVSIYLLDRKQWWTLIPGGILGIVAFFLLLAAAADYVWPVALIILGLLLLRGNLGARRRPAHRAPPPSAPMPSIDTDELDRAVEATTPERRRLPTLEEQIEAAIAEEPHASEEERADDVEAEDSEKAADIPTPPEMPEPPDVPSGPKVE